MFEDRVRARSFGDDAQQYDRTRPSYPSDLVDDLVDGGVADVVDVGCGTGLVARLIDARGCNVLGVEQDERMAAVARDHGIRVEIARFEDWEPAGRTFDLLTSGQAWHWIEPAAGGRKAAQVLRPGGRFAVFWNMPRHSPELMAAFVRIYGRLAPDVLDDSVALGTSTASDRGESRLLEHSDAFVSVENRTYRWTRHYTTAQWLDELPTHSAHRVLPPHLLHQLLDEVGAALEAAGGEFDVEYRTSAVFAIAR